MIPWRQYIFKGIHSAHPCQGRKQTQNIGVPELICRVAHPVPQGFDDVKYFEEVPPGTGSVDSLGYIKAPGDIDYKGFLTTERAKHLIGI